MSKHPPTSGRQKRTPRGVHLNVHNKLRENADDALEKQLREERRQRALDEARAEQARLERRIEREKVAPAIGPTLGALYVASHEEYDAQAFDAALDQGEPVDVVVHRPTPVDTPPLALLFPDLPWEGDGQESGAIGAGRLMLRQGYNIRKVVTMQGIGLKWLDDIPIDEMGFGLTEE